MAVRVALVDDHHLVRKGFVAIVNSLDGYEVCMDFPNGKEFVDALADTPLPDIAIVDLNMPVMNGFETLGWLQWNAPSVRPLALTFDAAEDAVIKAVRSGARGFLLKDAQPSELKFALDSLMLSGYYHTELVQQGMLGSPDLRTNGERHHDELMDQITPREMEFLMLVCSEKEHTYDQVATQMGIHRRSVDNFRSNLFEKFNIKSKTGLVLFAARNGLLRQS